MVIMISVCDCVKSYLIWNIEDRTRKDLRDQCSVSARVLASCIDLHEVSYMNECVKVQRKGLRHFFFFFFCKDSD